MVERLNLAPHPCHQDAYNSFPMIPFSLCDRPNHIHILRRLDLYRTYPLVPVGIMTHANVTPAFQALIRTFPCGIDQCRGVNGAPCPYHEDQDRCPYHRYIRQRAVLMCDSGVFTRRGATLAYSQLFETYARMAVDYGIMIDRLHDSAATIESARRALEAYVGYEGRFQLVAVAQGSSLDEYLQCYQQLKALGFGHIAIGGLLHKIEGSARYTRVEAESFLWSVISSIRSLFPDDWLFALGTLHPRRIPRLVEFRVWADSKWYLFQYPHAGQRDRDQG